MRVECELLPSYKDMGSEARRTLDKALKSNLPFNLKELEAKVKFEYQTRRTKSMAKADSVNKYVKYITDDFIPGATDEKAVKNKLDNLVGEITDNSVGKNGYVYNEISKNRNYLNSHLYNDMMYNKDPEVTHIFKQLVSKSDPDLDKRIHAYLSTVKDADVKTLDTLNAKEKIVADHIKQNIEIQHNMKVNSGRFDSKSRNDWVHSYNTSQEKVVQNQGRFGQVLKEKLNWAETFGIGTKNEVAPADLAKLQDKIIREWIQNSERGKIDIEGKVVDAQRGLVFNSPDDAFDFFAEFGQGDGLFDKMELDIRKTAADSGLASKFGMEYEKTIKDIFNYVKRHYKGMDVTRIEKRVFAQMKYMDGSMNDPALRKNNVARNFRMTRNVIRASLLGMSNLSAMLDILAVAMKSASISGSGPIQFGIDMADAIVTSTKMFVNKNGNIKKFAEDFQIMLEVERASIGSKFGDADPDSVNMGTKFMYGADKATAWAADKVQKISLAERTGNAVREASVEIQARKLQKMLKKNVRNGYEVNTLKAMGMTEPHIKAWNDATGGKISLVDAEFHLEHGNLDGGQKKVLRESMDMIGLYLNDAYNTGSSIGSLKSRAATFGVQPKGQVLEETISLFGTFKGPLIDTYRNFIEAKSAARAVGGKAAEAKLMVSAVAYAGALGMAIDYLRGGAKSFGDKDAEDRFNEEWVNASKDPAWAGKQFLNGVMTTGIFGLYGDIIGGGFEYANSRSLERIAGPGIGKPLEILDNIIRDTSKSVSGGEVDFTNTIKKVGKLAPFQNWYPTRPIIRAIKGDE